MKDAALPKVGGENMYKKSHVYAMYMPCIFSVVHIPVFPDLSRATSSNGWWGNAHTRASHVRAHTYTWLALVYALPHHYPLGWS